MKSKSIALLLVVAVGLGGWLLLERVSKPAASSAKMRTAVSTITHGHGLAVDLVNPDNVYIATHHGLILFEGGKLFQIGKKKDDYMGFSPDTSDPNTFFASGHPESGGNIGFQKSTDGGYSWQTISEGVNGPVDFHAMAVSPANPQYVYGWFQGNLQRSTDGGAHFEIVNKNLLTVQLVGDPLDAKTVYAASPSGEGILVSHDEGISFSSLSPALSGGAISGIAVDPTNPKHMLVFSEKLGGLVQSKDSGHTWQSVQGSMSGTILFVAFSPSKPSVVYALAHTNALYKSTDGGSTWALAAPGKAE